MENFTKQIVNEKVGAQLNELKEDSKYSNFVFEDDTEDSYLGDNDIASELEEMNKMVEESISKSGLFKEVNSVEELSESVTEDGKYIPNFEDMTESGKISETLKMFYDYNREVYFLVNERINERIILKSDSAKHRLFDEFKKHNIKLKSPASDLLHVKKVFVDFNVNKEKIYDNGFGEVYNEFFAEKTYFPTIDRLRKSTELRYTKDDLCVLSEECPYTYLLLNNLFENNAEYVNYFINYISTFVNTRKKNRTAILFAGVEGAGKGVLIDELLTKILSKDYVTNVVASSLKSQFNEPLENKLLVNFNEFSSDFSKADTATQRLKSLITDKTFLFERKMCSAFEMNNNFIVFLSQNYKNAVKMSMQDRRFSYFVQPKSLKQALVDNGYSNDTDKLVEAITGVEFDSFVRFLALYDYDSNYANTVIETAEKRASQSCTNSGSDIMEHNVKTSNFEEIEKDIENIIDMKDGLNMEKYSVTYLTYINNKNMFLAKVQNEVEAGYITSESLKFLYTFYVEDVSNKEDRYLSKVFNSLFGETVVKKIAGKPVRVRLLKNTKESEF